MTTTANDIATIRRTFAAHPAETVEAAIYKHSVAEVDVDADGDVCLNNRTWLDEDGLRELAEWIEREVGQSLAEWGA